MTEANVEGKHKLASVDFNTLCHVFKKDVLLVSILSMTFFFSTFFLIQACVVCCHYFHLPNVTIPRLHPLKLSEFTLHRPCDKSKEYRAYTCNSALKSI